MTANSALPNGWRCASSRARTRSPAPRRHSRNFKRPPVAPHHKPLRRLRQVGTWSDSNPRRMGAASACDRRTKVTQALARDPFEVPLVRAVDSARRERANRDAPRPAPSADHGSCEWGASALRCLPGLHAPRWRDVLQPTSASPSALKCLLFGVPIEKADAGLLCVHFQPRASTARGTDGQHE